MDIPTRSSHLFEQIHEIMWDKILRGEIVPSQRLKDIEWAKRLGVSRTPVREAMRKMQQEGILIPLSQGGYEVRSLSEKDRRELYRCRAALEALAVREAAEKFTPKAARQLELLLRGADDAIENDDLDQGFALTTEFHRLLIEFSQNAHLIGLCASLRKLVFFYRSARLNRVKSGKTDRQIYLRHLRAEQEEHHAIVAALSEGDGDKAVKLMEHHLLDTVHKMDVAP